MFNVWLEIKTYQQGSMDDANYNCPMIGIDLYGHDLDTFYGIGSWQECGA